MLGRLRRLVESAILETPIEPYARSTWRSIRRTPRYSPDIEKSHEYDFLTRCLYKKVLKPDSNCVDVGAHLGLLLRAMLKYAPAGRHWAIEPIPQCADFLKRTFPRATVVQTALSDAVGTATFQYFSDRPAYSGLRAQPHVGDAQIEEIPVTLDTLDRVVGDTPIDVVKIDVEGGEFHVLAGARELLERHRPLLVFEHGSGAIGPYGVTSADLYRLLSDFGYRISVLPEWFENKQALSLDAFTSTNEWMFVAHH